MDAFHARNIGSITRRLQQADARGLDIDLNEQDDSHVDLSYFNRAQELSDLGLVSCDLLRPLVVQSGAAARRVALEDKPPTWAAMEALTTLASISTYLETVIART